MSIEDEIRSRVEANLAGREDFLTPEGEEDSARWRAEILVSKAEWKNLFPGYQPLIGNSLHDFVSNSRLLG
jgi:hypothetical protein